MMFIIINKCYMAVSLTPKDDIFSANSSEVNILPLLLIFIKYVLPLSLCNVIGCTKLNFTISSQPLVYSLIASPANLFLILSEVIIFILILAFPSRNILFNLKYMMDLLQQYQPHKLVRKGHF